MKHGMRFSSPSGLRLSVIALTVLSATFVSSSLAQVPPPITPSGLNTQVNIASNPPVGKVQYDITGGTRPGGGPNIFHSFGNFNVPNSNIANFLNSGSVDLAGNTLAAGLPTTNILGRVTGGNMSNIFGVIKTTGFGNANLFLMNPAGFLFGPNATVNVGGMVSFSTADYLRLADGKLFNSLPDPVTDTILSTAPVAAYGFLGSNPSAITLEGSQLAVASGENISLVGGNITIHSGLLNDGTTQSARLSAPGGQIHLASVASPGEILTGTLAQSPNINGQSFGNLGSVHISEQSTIDVSGSGGGTVLIRGGNFVLDNSTISANVTASGPSMNGAETVGGGIDLTVNGNAVIQNGGVLETNIVGNVTPDVAYSGVQIKADHIELAGSDLPFVFTGIRSDVGTDTQPAFNGGNSGNINLEANTIAIRGAGTIQANVNGLPPPPGMLSPTSNAGNITLTANQNIELNNSTIGSVLLFDSGSAGNITLTSSHGSIIESGNLLPPNFVLNPGDPFPSVTPNIIFAQTLQSTGRAGNVTFNALEGDVVLAGALVVLSLSGPTQAGGSGQVHINAKNLQLTNFSTVQMDNFSPLPSGDFKVTLSGNLTVDNSRIITTARGPARAADLNITAHEVLVTGISSLSTETRSSGDAGNLNIFADSLEVMNGGQISSGTAQNPPILPFPGGPPELITFPPPTGAGGNITVHGRAGSSSSATSVLIDGTNSGVLTNTVGTGPAGNTIISAQAVTIQNGGTISAATSGTAPSATGGTITINANQVQVNSGGLITASTTGAGPGGSININAGSTFSSNAGAVSNTASQTTGGNINIGAGQSVTLTNGASVSASSTGQGSAGDVQIDAGQNFSATNSSVTTEALHSSGGAIKITTTPSGTVDLTNSTISASVNDGVGGGGSVDIDPQFVILQNSQILADAVFGPGGNINITTNLLLPDTTSVIRASSQFGQQGNIVIQSPVSPASGKLVPLGQKPLIATALVSQRCAALAGGSISSFTVAGRDSLPAEPGGWVSSPLALSMAGSNEGTATEAALSSFSEMAEETPLLSLRKVAPAGFLTQSFGAASSDCQS
jgi:filamentous hemagglutinin family protein